MPLRNRLSTFGTIRGLGCCGILRGWALQAGFVLCGILRVGTSMRKKVTERCDIKRPLVVIPKHNLLEYQKSLKRSLWLSSVGFSAGFGG